MRIYLVHRQHQPEQSLPIDNQLALIQSYLSLSPRGAVARAPGSSARRRLTIHPGRDDPTPVWFERSDGAPGRYTHNIYAIPIEYQ